MKYFYLQSDNNTLEKSRMPYDYFTKSMRNYGKFIPFVTDDFDFIFNVFKLYLNSPYFNKYQKEYINNYTIKFRERKKEIDNKKVSNTKIKMSNFVNNTI